MSEDAGAEDFLDSVLTHLASFAAEHQVAANQVRVALTLADGTTWGSKGLRVTSAPGMPGCVMLQSDPDGPPEAMVVHREHVFKATFDSGFDQPMPFGFQAPRQP